VVLTLGSTLHVTRAIENQLDYTHLPFVHKNTIGRNYHLPTNPTVDTSDTTISVYFRERQTKPSFTFIFPNIWILHISDKMQLVVYFVPIDEQHTKFYLTTYRGFLNWKFLNPLFNFSNAIILNQDRHVVESQGTEPSYLAQVELLMKHDSAIKHFRKLWQNLLIKN
jgi:phenylpropionate dioxygenase-like ring-hydroxylating dioxygenase large terminal subunit